MSALGLKVRQARVTCANLLICGHSMPSKPAFCKRQTSQRAPGHPLILLKLSRPPDDCLLAALQIYMITLSDAGAN